MVPWLHETRLEFPEVSTALTEPNGLLCAGGDLSVDRLRLAYSKGIFPWFSEGEPILWWSPDPRLVLEPSLFKRRRSLKKSIRAQRFQMTANRCFERVVALCAQTRQANGTWITQAMQTAYSELNKAGYGFSVETWQDDRLVGGLYGVRLGRVLFGESMVSCVADASKAALSHVCEHAELYPIELIDCQVPSSHLISLGATLIPRATLIQRIEDLAA